MISLWMSLQRVSLWKKFYEHDAKAAFGQMEVTDMKLLKQNRAASFIAVTLVYIFATAVGVLVYRALALDWRLSLLIADAAATVVTFRDNRGKKALLSTKNRRGCCCLSKNLR